MSQCTLAVEASKHCRGNYCSTCLQLQSDMTQSDGKYISTLRLDGSSGLEERLCAGSTTVVNGGHIISKLQACCTLCTAPVQRAPQGSVANCRSNVAASGMNKTSSTTSASWNHSMRHRGEEADAAAPAAAPVKAEVRGGSTESTNAPAAALAMALRAEAGTAPAATAAATAAAAEDATTGGRPAAEAAPLARAGSAEGRDDSMLLAAAWCSCCRAAACNGASKSAGSDPAGGSCPSRRVPVATAIDEGLSIRAAGASGREAGVAEAEDGEGFAGAGGEPPFTTAITCCSDRSCGVSLSTSSSTSIKSESSSDVPDPAAVC